MKKFAIILALALCIGSAAAMAEYAGRNAEEDYSPYVGLNVGIHSVRYSELSPDADYNAGLVSRFFSGEVALGLKSNTLGAELFYKLSTNEAREGRVGIYLDEGVDDGYWYDGYVEPRSTNKFQWEGWGLNTIYSIPMRKNAAIELLFGLGFYSGDITAIVYDDKGTQFVPEDFYGPMHEHWNETLGVSFGVGFSKRVTGGLDLRGGLKYTMFKGDFLMDRDRQIYAGARYVFE